MSARQYVGRELELFAEAKSWKQYWSSLVLAYLRGDILEVGAGVGTNTPLIKGAEATSWTCLEPDPKLAAQMRERFAEDASLTKCRVQLGTIADLGGDSRFDAIVYIDVLEHIADDKGELRRASQLLRAGGRLVVLSPAYTWLYTSFDRAIGHLRRYQKKTLQACGPEDCRLCKIIYLDSAGVLASAANRMFLKQSLPTLRQILFWDRCLVPISRIADRLIRHTFGKSILAIWIKA